MAENFNEKLVTKKHVIAGLNVLMSYGGRRLAEQAENYVCEYSVADDVVVSVDADKVKNRQAENRHLTLDSCEYIMTGGVFYSQLIEHGGFMLHSSAVVYEGRAYLFSAPCGTGKSTHTANWCRRFDGAVILNDDKPAIRMIGSQAVAFGTPWSGKTDKQINMSAPVAAVAFIEQAQQNSIERLSAKEAVTKILWQTVRPKSSERADMLFKTIDKFLQNVPVYKLRCNMELDSAEIAYEAMSKCK